MTDDYSPVESRNRNMFETFPVTLLTVYFSLSALN